MTRGSALRTAPVGVLPDRLSTDKASPFYWDAAVARVGVRLGGVEQKTVVEYCVSGGWVRRVVVDPETGLKKRNLFGSGFRIERVHGKVEPHWTMGAHP